MTPDVRDGRTALRLSTLGLLNCAQEAATAQQYRHAYWAASV